MQKIPLVGKREFIQHTSLYLKKAEAEGALIITHQNKAALKLIRIQESSIEDLKGTITHITVQGDINEPILPGYDEW